VAALFQPLRRRVQRAVDRASTAATTTPPRTIEAFAARLRDHTDLPTLAAELLAVADRTLQPTQVSLWLAQPPTWMAGPAARVGLDLAEDLPGHRGGVALAEQQVAEQVASGWPSAHSK
jgi:hypothetical protein